MNEMDYAKQLVARMAASALTPTYPLVCYWCGHRCEEPNDHHGKQPPKIIQVTLRVSTALFGANF